MLRVHVICSWSRVIVVGTGEPLAPRSTWRQLTQAFLREFPGAYFYHVTQEFAGVLHDLGYYINGCGTETTLQVGVAVCRCVLAVASQGAAGAVREPGSRLHWKQRVVER
jgi:hypothetical protein